MISIPELLNRRITVEENYRHSPSCLTLIEPLTGNSGKEHGEYETGVFNFLFVNRDALQIKNVIKFNAILVDGALELLNGNHLAIEIKYRMNWEKACQAEYQFRNFFKAEGANAVSGVRWIGFLREVFWRLVAASQIYKL